MSDFVFARGDDVVIRVDSQILGGVLKAVCSTQNTVENIEEFLTDVPVAKIAKSKYGILLTLNSQSQNLFDNAVFDSIEFADKSVSVKYLNCHVDSIEGEINPKGVIEYKVKITAESREVL